MRRPITQFHTNGSRAIAVRQPFASEIAGKYGPMKRGTKSGAPLVYRTTATGKKKPQGKTAPTIVRVQVQLPQQPPLVKVQETRVLRERVVVKEKLVTRQEIRQERIIEREKQVVRERMVEREKPAVSERNAESEKPVVRERIVEREKPVVRERIVEREKPVVRERIVEREQPIVRERIVGREKPVVRERIVEREKPVVRDRIVEREKPVVRDRIVEREKPVVKARIVDKANTVARERSADKEADSGSSISGIREHVGQAGIVAGRALSNALRQIGKNGAGAKATGLFFKQQRSAREHAFRLLVNEPRAAEGQFHSADGEAMNEIRDALSFATEQEPIAARFGNKTTIVNQGSIEPTINKRSAPTAIRTVSRVASRAGEPRTWTAVAMINRHATNRLKKAFEAGEAKDNLQRAKRDTMDTRQNAFDTFGTGQSPVARSLPIVRPGRSALEQRLDHQAPGAQPDLSAGQVYSSQQTFNRQQATNTQQDSNAQQASTGRPNLGSSRFEASRNDRIDLIPSESNGTVASSRTEGTYGVDTVEGNLPHATSSPESRLIVSAESAAIAEQAEKRMPKIETMAIDRSVIGEGADITLESVSADVAWPSSDAFPVRLRIVGPEGRTVRLLSARAERRGSSLILRKNHHARTDEAAEQKQSPSRLLLKRLTERPDTFVTAKRAVPATEPLPSESAYGRQTNAAATVTGDKPAGSGPKQRVLPIYMSVPAQRLGQPTPPVRLVTGLWKSAAAMDTADSADRQSGFAARARKRSMATPIDKPFAAPSDNPVVEPSAKRIATPSGMLVHASRNWLSRIKEAVTRQSGRNAQANGSTNDRIILPTVSPNNSPTNPSILPDSRNQSEINANQVVTGDSDLNERTTNSASVSGRAIGARTPPPDANGSEASEDVGQAAYGEPRRFEKTELTHITPSVQSLNGQDGFSSTGAVNPTSNVTVEGKAAAGNTVSGSISPSSARESGGNASQRIVPTNRPASPSESGAELTRSFVGANRQTGTPRLKLTYRGRTIGPLSPSNPVGQTEAALEGSERRPVVARRSAEKKGNVPTLIVRTRGNPDNRIRTTSTATPNPTSATRQEPTPNAALKGNPPSVLSPSLSPTLAVSRADASPPPSAARLELRRTGSAIASRSAASAQAQTRLPTAALVASVTNRSLPAASRTVHRTARAIATANRQLLTDRKAPGRQLFGAPSGQDVQSLQSLQSAGSMTMLRLPNADDDDPPMAPFESATQVARNTHRRQTAASRQASVKAPPAPAPLEFRRNVVQQAAAQEEPATRTVTVEAPRQIDAEQLQKAIEAMPQLNPDQLAERVYTALMKKMKFEQRLRGY